MRRIISVLLILLISLLSIEITVSASVDNVQSYNSALAELKKEKLICKATIDDDFEDDSVIVVFTNEVSRELKDFSNKDFSDVSAIKIKNLTEVTQKMIEDCNCESNFFEKRSEFNCASHSSVDDMYINEKEFFQIVKVDLGVKSKENVLRSVKILEKREDVLMAFPNYIYKSSAIPNDTLYGEQWAIPQISLPSAWNITSGNNSVSVGIIDSGIDGTHPDLVNRVDTMLSKDFLGGNSPLTDEGGHGTAVADVDYSGSVNTVDATQIQKYVGGIIEYWDN